MTFADFIAVLDRAPQPNGVDVPVESARMHLRDVEAAFDALTNGDAWAHAIGDEQQRAIEAVADARNEWKRAQRRAREAGRMTVEWADEESV